jgi:hypothetical protein
MALLLALSILFPFPVVLLAAVAHAETTQAYDGGAGATSNTTAAQTFGSNELALGFLTCWDGGASCQTVTNVRLDNTTDLTQAATVSNGAAFLARMYYLPSYPSAASHSLTVNFGGSNTFESLYLIRVTGANVSLDGTCSTNSGNAGTPTAGNVSGAATSFYLGGIADSTAAPAAGSGWTQPTNGSTSISQVQYKANPGATPQNPTWMTASGDWAAIGCAFPIPGTSKPCLLALLGVGSC